MTGRAVRALAEALDRNRNRRATRWRKLSAGRKALLVVAYPDLVVGFKIGNSTVHRYVHEAVALLAARGRAFVILESTLVRIGRLGKTSAYDRPTTRASTSATA